MLDVSRLIPLLHYHLPLPCHLCQCLRWTWRDSSSTDRARRWGPPSLDDRSLWWRRCLKPRSISMQQNDLIWAGVSKNLFYENYFIFSSRELCVTEQQVKIWFQNRRTKWKKQENSGLEISKKLLDSNSDIIDDSCDSNKEDLTCSIKTALLDTSELALKCSKKIWLW